MLALLLAPALAFADDVDLELRAKVPQGKGKPTLVVTSNARIDKLTIELAGGPQPLKLSAGPLKPGQKKAFPLETGAGPVHYTGTLSIHYAAREGKEDASMPLDFEAEVVRPPELTVKTEDVDLEHHRLKASFSRRAAKASVEVTGEAGNTLASEELDLHDAPAGTPLTLEWKQAEGTPLKVHVQLTDPDGFYSGIDLFPWRVEIPHEEVSFASGSSAVTAEEAPKLDKSLALINQAVARAQRFAEIRLYVAGATDTVGGEASNQQLSEARARSIASYFRAHGLKVPIYYDGFGEHALAVATPDETAEARNRRAAYIVSITDPPVAGATVQAHWKKL